MYRRNKVTNACLVLYLLCLNIIRFRASRGAPGEFVVMRCGGRGGGGGGGVGSGGGGG